MTPRQAELLHFIAAYQRERGGASPSFDEMRAYLGLKSKGHVNRMVKSLKHEGFIEHDHHRIRSIRILRLPRDLALEQLPDAPPCIAEARIWLEAQGYRLTLSRIAKPAR
jgi:SOS-response transcriptional repressor LexA